MRNFKLVIPVLALLVLFAAQPVLAGSSASSEANVNDVSATVIQEDHSNVRSWTNRGLPIPADIHPTPNMPTMMHNGGTVGNIQQVREITMYRATFTYKMLKILADDESAKVTAKPFNVTNPPEEEPADDAEITMVLIVYDKEKKAYTRPAKEFIDAMHITVRGKSKTTTIAAVALAGIAAIKQGCDKLAITGAGARKILKAGGWGIMIGSNYAHLNEDAAKGASGVVSVGGLGYAKTWAGYGYSPWLQAWGIITVVE